MVYTLTHGQSIMAGSTSEKAKVAKRPAVKVAARPAKQRVGTNRPVQYQADDHAHAEEEIATPEWAQPAPACRPDWARHIVRVLQHNHHLPAERTTEAKDLELTIWSDCSGINSDMFALKDIGAALLELTGIRVQWKLYYVCDCDKQSREFANLNHDPLHVGDAMEHRNFETGQMWCEMHRANHDMPRHGLDVYIGTYPCSPWSRRGKRTGFSHPDAAVFIIGVKSIAYMTPAVWVIEIGEVPSQACLDEILQKITDILQTSQATYTVQMVRNLTPTWSGYPTRRTRLFIIGWRKDIDGDLVAPLHSLIKPPCQCNTLS